MAGYASIAYGMVVSKADAEELVHGMALYSAAKECTELKSEIDDYFELYDDEGENDAVEVSYPAEILGRVAEHHPDYAGRLDYCQLGNTASFGEDDEAIFIYIASTFQEVLFHGAMLPISEPSPEDIQLLGAFKAKFIQDGAEVTKAGWTLGSAYS